jgi:hypothetical protein
MINVKISEVDIRIKLLNGKVQCLEWMALMNKLNTYNTQKPIKKMIKNLMPSMNTLKMKSL